FRSKNSWKSPSKVPYFLSSLSSSNVDYQDKVNIHSVLISTCFYPIIGPGLKKSPCASVGALSSKQKDAGWCIPWHFALSPYATLFIFEFNQCMNIFRQCHLARVRTVPSIRRHTNLSHSWTVMRRKRTMIMRSTT